MCYSTVSGFDLKCTKWMEVPVVSRSWYWAFGPPLMCCSCCSTVIVDFRRNWCVVLFLNLLLTIYFWGFFGGFPQAFTTDFRVHWAQHPLRPEFAESTYFLYKVKSLSFFWLLVAPRVLLVLCFSYRTSSLSPGYSARLPDGSIIGIKNCSRNVVLYA